MSAPKDSGQEVIRLTGPFVTMVAKALGLWKEKKKTQSKASLMNSHGKA